MRFLRGAVALRRGLSAATDVEIRRLALEEKKLALSLEMKKLELSLEEKKLAQGRGAVEAVLGVSRETAQMVNLVAAGVVFVASGAYLTAGMVHDTLAQLSVVAAKADSASADVRSLIAGRGAPPRWDGYSLLTCFLQRLGVRHTLPWRSK